MSDKLPHHLLITGSSGFVGQHFTQSLLEKDFSFIRLIRDGMASVDNSIYLSELQSHTIDVVVHLAGRAHVVHETADDPGTEFRIANTEFTVAVARAAAAAGVKRFVFLSSIGVNGINNESAFTCFDTPAPVEAYAISKLEAENELKQIASETSMEVVIIRPPLVYGANAPGNFGKLTQLAQKKLPLPLGAICNKRSLVALDNLVDLIITCIDHPKAANQTFLVSDDQDVSTTELLQMMARASGRKSRLIPVPVNWLRLAAKLIGKQVVINRLCGNLQIDISHTKDTLGWKPPITVEEGITRCFAPVAGGD